MRNTIEKPRKTRAKIQKRFHIDCYPYIFSDEELEILESRGHDLKALAAGKRKAITKEEQLFVKVCKGQAIAISVMETAWKKYLNRHQIFADFNNKGEDYLQYLIALR
ncbi:MAG: DUF413 domain-containing protein [Bacteroidales bacterium]|nr:DUF413 domain-containing protein [Bacteroidales bacterium]